MDKFLIRKDVYEDLIEKGYGNRDLSKLTKKQITDKNGHKRTVYVRNDEQPAAQNQGKAQDELAPEVKAELERKLNVVMAGPDENALFVKDKGMLNKKDAIAYLEGKLGKKSSSSLREQIPSIREKEESLTVNEADKFYGNYGLKKVGESVDRKGWTVKEYKNNAGETWIGKFNKEGKYVGSEYNPVGAKKNSSAEGHLESDNPPNTDITKEDEERFGKQALSGLSGKRTGSEKDDAKTGYEDLSIWELQDKFNSNDGKNLSGNMKDEHEKVKKELEKRTSENKPTSKGFAKGDTVFDRYGETSEVLATSGDNVYVKDSRGRKEWKSENSFKGKRPTQDEIKTYKISDIERVDKNTLKLGDVSATKNWDNSWSIKNAQGEEVALALRMEDVKNAMLKSANRKPGETKFPNVSKDEKVATLANSFKGKYGRTEKEWKDAFNNAPEEILENRYEEYANKKK